MISVMKIFIIHEQKIKLEHLHDTTRDGRVRERISVNFSNYKP